MVIDTLAGIQLGGITQWIRIRGSDASNPVLLLMQQGPGFPMINEARRTHRATPNATLSTANTPALATSTWAKVTITSVSVRAPAPRT